MIYGLSSGRLGGEISRPSGRESFKERSFKESFEITESKREFRVHLQFSALQFAAHLAHRRYTVGEAFVAPMLERRYARTAR